MVEIQRPTTLDVTKTNPNEFIYIKGNEFTNGSLRFTTGVVQGNIVIEVQERIDGVWQPGSLQTGANSIFVGALVRLSVIGTRLISTEDELLHTLSSARIEDGISIANTTVLDATAFFERVIFQPDESGEFIGTSIETVGVNTSTHIMFGAFYVKTGSVAATAPIRIQQWRGSDDTGLLLFDQTYPVSDFPANIEIKLIVSGFLEFAFNEVGLTRISSDATFSLRANFAVDNWWFAVDFSTVKDDDLLQTTEWVSGDTFAQGDWTTQDKRVYECNVTGIQTGTFNDNLDKWDQLISTQAFDQVLTSIEGEVLVNSNGNILLSQQ